MARMDEDGVILQVNQALTQVLGVREGTLLGRTLESVTHADDAGSDRRQRADLLRGRVDSYEVEMRLLDATGEEVPTQLSFSVAREEDDTLRALLVQVQDVRERRRAQAAREELVREQTARAEAEQLAERQRAISSITDAALASLGIDDLLRELLARISDLLGVDGAAVLLEEGDLGHVVVHAAGEAAAYVQEHGSPQGGLATRIMAERRPIVVTDIAADGELEAHPLGRTVTSLMGVPLLVGDEAIGALEVGTLFQRRFSDEDIDLLQLAADRAALAIQRMRLFERQQGIAEELQRSLLPQTLPIVPGLNMAARYFAGGAGTRVGGDWYDTIALPGGRVAMVIGDVAGRGVFAAAMMGQLRKRPARVRARGAGPGDRARAAQPLHALAVVGQHGHRARDGHRAGHGTHHLRERRPSPPLVLGADGVVRPLKETLSVPLGALDVGGYEQATAQLQPGSTLVLYTDGLVEQRDQLIDRGIEKLELALVDGDSAEPEQLCERIIGARSAATSRTTT
jgi:PAS domain S-box-containing protein